MHARFKLPLIRRLFPGQRITHLNGQDVSSASLQTIFTLMKGNLILISKPFRFRTKLLHFNQLISILGSFVSARVMIMISDNVVGRGLHPPGLLRESANGRL